MQEFGLQASRLDPEVWQIKIRGMLDASTLPMLAFAIDELFAKGGYKLVLNLEELEYVSSDGLGYFISSHVTALKHGGQIVIAAAQSAVHETFDLVGLTKVLRFFDDEKAALSEFHGS